MLAEGPAGKGSSSTAFARGLVGPKSLANSREERDHFNNILISRVFLFLIYIYIVALEAKGNIVNIP